MVAPTGKAALEVRGQTTWSFAGWTPKCSSLSKEALLRWKRRKSTQMRLEMTDVLIIDEISMVDNFFFERLSFYMKDVRKDNRPFGGVQVIVTGDFCQLPPVKPFQYCVECGRELKIVVTDTEYRCSKHGIYFDSNKWAFQSNTWEVCVTKPRL